MCFLVFSCWVDGITQVDVRAWGDKLHGLVVSSGSAPSTEWKPRDKVKGAVLKVHPHHLGHPVSFVHRPKLLLSRAGEQCVHLATEVRVDDACPEQQVGI